MQILNFALLLKIVFLFKCIDNVALQLTTDFM